MISATLRTWAQDADWVKSYGNGGIHGRFQLVTDGQQYLYGAARLSGGDLAIDEEQAEVLGFSAILLAKWDTLGNATWVRTAGASCSPIDNETIRHIAYDDIGPRIMVAGYFNCPNTHFGTQVISGHGDPNSSDLFVASYDTAGNCSWVGKAYGGDVEATRLLTDGNSRTFMMGNCSGQTTFYGSIPVTVAGGGFIACYAMDGTLESVERVLVNGRIQDAAWLAADEWILTGKTSAGAVLYGLPTPAPSGVFAARTDTLGSIQWMRTFRSSGDADVWKCASGPGDITYVMGTFTDSLFLESDTLIAQPGVQYVFLTALSGSGDVEWAVHIGSSAAVYAFDLHTGREGDAYLLGQFKRELDLGNGMLVSDHSTDGFAARYNSGGTCVGATYFGRVFSGIGSIVPTESGFYVSDDYDSTLVIGSQTWPLSGQGAHDLFLAKFPTLTGFTSIEELRSSTQEGLHIYANPNNGLCTIDLPAGGEHARDLVLSVYDQSGALVQRAPLTFTDEGLRLDIRAQAHGTYHVELVGGGERYTGSIVFE